MCIREALAKHFGDKIIGRYHKKNIFKEYLKIYLKIYNCIIFFLALGGVILMENGKVKVHVVKPDLAKSPLESPNDLGKWLHFIELAPPSVGLGCIVSHDPVILFTIICYLFINII